MLQLFNPLGIETNVRYNQYIMFQDLVYMRLPDREEEILKVIEKYIDRNNISHTLREIMEMLKLKSPSTIHVHLNNLEQKGYISKKSKTPRSIVLLK